MIEGELRIAVLDGDGIGPEVVPVAVRAADRALTARGVAVRWDRLPFGRAAIDSHGAPIPEQTLDALEGYDLMVVGPHDSASYPGEHRSAPAPGAILRKRFGLYANLRPARAIPGVAATAPDIDLLIVRENSEGLYADRNMAVGSGEFMPTPDVALAVGLVTRQASERIAERAFELARTRRGHVTVVHKANVLRLTTGLFRDACLDVARRYPDVTVDQQHVDAMAALLVRRPADFDVVVTENLFGDILSDLAAELSGSLGLASSINCSDTRVMAQAVHGAAPDIAGRGVADPIAMLHSVASALQWYGLRHDDARPTEAGAALRQAVAETVASGIGTPDLGGTSTTAEFGERVVSVL
ncbi:MAG: isocitrate/isopropylmalate dehydrogenase family protein [Gordonia sp. (in: high G+C Gram-positive bacteria)]|uniref:isocitrate/isopropylmalate dehydrogenase family protein n=1 Tax=Gordonia sp. (in: high G+C Gram-positive bacteria) TaxID=84139 RepID=UPI0039E42EF0